MERPSVALFLAFCLAQLISSIIAAFGDWGFTAVEGISGGYIGFIWIWNIVWFFPLDLSMYFIVVDQACRADPPAPPTVKFGMRALIGAYNKKRGARPPTAIKDGLDMHRTQSRHESLYSNRVSFIVRILDLSDRRANTR